jgi:hypothetical protein
LSEADAGAEEQAGEEEESSGPPIGVFVLVAAIVILVAVSGLFAVGFIPPLKGGHATTVTTTARGQFITVTSTVPTTQTVDDGTATSTVTLGNVTTITSTATSVSTSTLTDPANATVTELGQVTTKTSFYPLTTTTTTTRVSTTTQTVTATNPLNISITMVSASNTLYAGDSFVLNIAVQSRVMSTNLSLFAYQPTPQGSYPILTFFPSLPEIVSAPLGSSDFVIQGTFSPHAVTGEYEMEVEVAAISLQTGFVVTNMNDQFLMQLHEPLTFTGAVFPTSSSQFNGTCAATNYTGVTVPTWVWKCGIITAPGVNETLSFTVSNLSNSPICIQTSLGSNALTGYVSMTPYPFCPGGGPGVYVPAGAVNWPFTYLVQAGTTAGSALAYFTFSR